MKKITATLSLAVAILATASTPSLRAAILLDNTSLGVDPGSGFVLGDPVWQGLSITTGGQAQTIRSITLAPVYNYGSSFTDITVDLFSGAAGEGALLASDTFLNVAINGTPSVYTWTLTDNYLLGANSSYLFKISGSLADAGIAGPNDSNVSTGTSGWTYNGRYLYSTYSSSVMGPFPSTPYILLSDEAGSAAVPEPGQVAASLLLLAGIGGYVFLKRRKSAKTAVATA